MWSYVQRRNVRRMVQDELKNKSNGLGITPSSIENGGIQPDHDQPEGQLTQNPDIIPVCQSGQEDPLNPQNWPLIARAKNIAILALLIFVQGWAGAAESMANSAASKGFNVSKVAENLSTAMYLFGVGSGALFAGPLSETVGRNPTYLASSFASLFFMLGAALTPTFGGQVVCRFFIGLCSSATLGINGSSVRDQFRSVKRSFVFPLIAWANVAAPMLAPVAGGWIVQRADLGWRWTEWITMIITGAALVIAILFLPETYFPLLLDWKAQELRRATGDKRYTSEHEQAASFFGRMRRVLPLPATFFSSEPVILAFGLYLILLYIILFSFLTGLEYTFKMTYGLSTGQTGSCFAAIASGATFFTLTAPGLYSWARHTTGHVHGASLDPEFRLWPAMVTAPLLPISLFWLGWTNYLSISIWCGLAACFCFGIVVTATYVSLYEYIIDSYHDHSAIALASITASRYLIAGGMVMASRPMYDGIGVHWVMTLLGCLAVILASAPILCFFYGPRLRARSQYAGSLEESE